MQYNLEVPINQVSFGQVSIAILRQFHARGLTPNIFPIGQVDLRGQPVDDSFTSWLSACCNKALKSFKRNEPTFRLWHLHNESHRRLTDKSILLTFYETDSPTEYELNIIKNQNLVLFTSEYSSNTFREFGLNNIKTIQLGFDRHNFYQTNKSYLPGKIVWGLYGKLEWQRKRHFKILQAWIKKYGNNPEHVLHAAIYNPFIKPEEQQNLLAQNLGQVPFNVQFVKWSETNSEYNDVLNSANIVLGLSGGEGRDLPVFHSVALGKHCLALNCHAYKDYLDCESSVLIVPSSKIKAADGIFFHDNQPFNQGCFYDFDINDFNDGCDKVVERYKLSPININGLKLQQLTYEKTVDEILILMNNI